MREKNIYKETFQAEAFFDDKLLPRTKHADIQPVKMRALAAGTVQRGDELFEFHDVRLYFKKEK